MSLEKRKRKPKQLTFDDVLYDGGPSTLKMQVRKGFTLMDAIEAATNFVKRNDDGITRVEFPYDGCYHVVAKLKN